MFNVNRLAVWTALMTISLGGHAWADDAEPAASKTSQWIGVMCVPVDDALRARVRREFPVPQAIDFRMSVEEPGGNE